MNQTNYTENYSMQQNSKVPQLPKETQEKLDAMESKLDKFSKEITKEFKDITAVSLLPPTQINPEERLTPEEIEKIKDWPKLREDIINKIIAKANQVDQNIFITVMDIAEVRENCFDAKYEILEMIAGGAALFDPKDFLAAIKICQVHKNMVLKKFDKYIVSYVGVGSLFRGDAKSHDIDVYISFTLVFQIYKDSKTNSPQIPNQNLYKHISILRFRTRKEAKFQPRVGKTCNARKRFLFRGLK